MDKTNINKIIITNYASILKEKCREPRDPGDLALLKGWTGCI